MWMATVTTEQEEQAQQEEQEQAQQASFHRSFCRAYKREQTNKQRITHTALKRKEQRFE